MVDAPDKKMVPQLLIVVRDWEWENADDKDFIYGTESSPNGSNHISLYFHSDGDSEDDHMKDLMCLEV